MRDLQVEILAVATAVPDHSVQQEEVLERAKKVFPFLGRLDGIYSNTGIDTRYSCEHPDWYHTEHGWEERTDVFQRHALDLLERVAIEAVERAGLGLRDIDAIVTNTITGLAIPSLDAMLCNRIDFREDIQRLPIFGFGCGGGVAGIARSAQLAQSMPGANVLFLTVDLCTLCLRPNDQSVGMYVSAALFGDGAAGLVLRARNGGGASPGALGSIQAVGDHFWRDSERIMGWDIKDDGFGVVLSPQLPALLRDELPRAVTRFLVRHDLTLEAFAGFLFHPGGRKILETVEAALGISREKLIHSWETLRRYGNMSSATALFVLKGAIEAGASGRHLVAAFGPGFSAYFVVADL